MIRQKSPHMCTDCPWVESYPLHVRRNGNVEGYKVIQERDAHRRSFQSGLGIHKMSRLCTSEPEFEQHILVYLKYF